MPVAHRADGLPTGVQLVGPACSDRTLLAVAEYLAPLPGEMAESVIGPWTGCPLWRRRR
ncbi:hypothetical protein [Streptomyces sp. S.PB5]|uniref:hypothetical protein n=1 Tax=Streptomyces sp. S.PB5 TaxID=3020844 RepID=UPI0025AF1787|nr:hypothetical protein [Streptomyces sp. S.PB5]MDN3027105.1 hypothetical protein [Streptomyces sp. S.PB5]